MGCPWSVSSNARMGDASNCTARCEQGCLQGKQAAVSSVFRVSLWGLAGMAGPPTATRLSATQHPLNTDQHGPCSRQMTKPCRSSACRGHGQISSAWLWPCGVKSWASVCLVLRRGLPTKRKPHDEWSGGLVKQRFFHNTQSHSTNMLSTYQVWGAGRKGRRMLPQL